MDLQIEDYSSRSFVVRGETKEYKEELKQFGGKYNPNLRGGPGWVFGSRRREEVEQFVRGGGKGGGRRKTERKVERKAEREEREEEEDVDVEDDEEEEEKTENSTLRQELEMMKRDIKLLKKQVKMLMLYVEADECSLPFKKGF